MFLHLHVAQNKVWQMQKLLTTQLSLTMNKLVKDRVSNWVHVANEYLLKQAGILRSLELEVGGTGSATASAGGTSGTAGAGAPGGSPGTMGDAGSSTARNPNAAAGAVLGTYHHLDHYTSRAGAASPSAHVNEVVYSDWVLYDWQKSISDDDEFSAASLETTDESPESGGSDWPKADADRREVVAKARATGATPKAAAGQSGVTGSGAAASAKGGKHNHGKGKGKGGTGAEAMEGVVADDNDDHPVEFQTGPRPQSLHRVDRMLFLQSDFHLVTDKRLYAGMDAGQQHQTLPSGSGTSKAEDADTADVARLRAQYLDLADTLQTLPAAAQERAHDPSPAPAGAKSSSGKPPLHHTPKVVPPPVTNKLAVLRQKILDGRKAPGSLLLQNATSGEGLHLGPIAAGREGPTSQTNDPPMNNHDDSAHKFSPWQLITEAVGKFLNEPVVKNLLVSSVAVEKNYSHERDIGPFAG